MGGDGKILSFAFNTDKVGYAGGELGFLCKTGDSGKTWTKLSPPRMGDVISIACPDTMTRWIISLAHFPSQDEIALAAYQRWESNDRPTNTSVLDWNAAEQGLTFPGGIFQSSDAGLSWTNRTPSGFEIYDLSQSFDKEIFGLSNKTLFQFSANGVFNHRLDTITELSGTNIFYVCAISSKRICLAGYATSGAVFISLDQGQTWQSKGGADNGPYGIFFLDNKYGWCSSGNYAGTCSIFGTSDGGLTWTRKCVL